MVTTQIKDVVARFAKDGIGLSLSSGWNAAVRNAIGHATYSLDIQTQTIQFEDRPVSKKVNLWFSDKDTISKTYDSRFTQIFKEEYEKNWKSQFEQAHITYFFTLIDDTIARIMRAERGFY